MAKKNNKTTKKTSSDRTKPKSSQKQRLENTDMWHLCQAGSVERPWGTLGDLKPVYHPFTIVCEITLPQAVSNGLPWKSIL